MKNQFFNIAATEISKITTSATETIAELQGIKTTEEILSNWRFKSMMTAASLNKKWELSALVAYLSKRINKETEGKISKVKSEVLAVSDAVKVISSISISVEWAKSRTWGNCPAASVRVCFTDNTCDNYKSGRITGYGFDKESTAIAQALNKCSELLNALYTVKDSNIIKENQNLFGYGSGYGVKPYFEGGVGVSCYPAIFKSIGYEWSSVSSGKTFDVYAVAKNIN